MFKKFFKPTLKHSLEGEVTFSNCSNITDIAIMSTTVFNMGARLFSLYYNISLDESLKILYDISKSGAIKLTALNGVLKE